MRECMIGSHPGGRSLTERLFALAGIGPPGRVLDLGAGTGESVRYLMECGFEAEGIDLLTGKAPDRSVRFGDMRALPFPDECAEVCLAECSVSGCGDGPAALGEAFRVLRPGGSLLLSDVFFHHVENKGPCMREACSEPGLWCKEELSFSMPEPLGMECWRKAWRDAGFVLKGLADETPLWREFFLESLWNGNADPACVDFFKKAGRAGCGYFLAWLWKGGDHGTV